MKIERKGNWIETHSGIKFYPLDPRKEEILVDDIIHAISKMCRFGGHSSKFYSVAEHSVLVYRYLKDTGASLLTQFYGLIHDFTEAYLIDLPRPIKDMLPEYSKLEHELFKVIWDSFEIPDIQSADKKAVKYADGVVLSYEANVLCVNKNRWAPSIGLPYEIKAMYPEEAKHYIQGKFIELLTEIKAHYN